MNGKLQYLVCLLLLTLMGLHSHAAIVPQTASLTSAPVSPQANPFQQKILAMLGGGSSDSMMLLQNPQYAGILQLLNQIPSEIVAQFLEQYSRGVLDPQSAGYNPSTNFTNWGDTVSTAYENILYPSNTPYASGKQIPSIQQFIKSASRQGKRVRGAGLRHSWSNIFADPNQYLVSFYPFDVIEGTSDVIEYYANAMTQLQAAVSKLNIEHIAQIRKVGEISSSVQIDGKPDVSVRKHLVKVGAGVSNQQLRKWAISNGYQYRTSVLMVEMNFVGTISTCSHGSGKDVQTIADMVYEIEFIDFNGNRQVISKRDNPQLIGSAIGSLGLLGVTIFVTIQMEDLEVVLTNPVNTYKDFTLPWPKDYPTDKVQKRLQRPEYKAWLDNKNGSALPNWNENFQNFKNALNQTYAEWFYFPIQGVHVLQNTWNTVGKKTPELMEKIRKDNGMYIEDYPPESVRTFSKFSQFLSSYLAKDERTLGIALALFKSPFAFMPRPNLYIDYPNAVHFERGAQNTMLRNFELQINIPTINCNGSLVPDYDLIQRIWWAGMEVAEEHADVITIALEMRFFKGSHATLAPEYDYDYVCSIELIRSKVLNTTSEAQWRRVIVKFLSAFRALKDSDGKQLTIRPHWGKEWDAIPEVKSFLLQDEGLKQNIRKFLKDYKEIAKLKNFNYERNLYTFSNAIYRQLLNNAITDPQEKIK